MNDEITLNQFDREAPEIEKIEKYKEILGESKAVFVLSMSATEKKGGEGRRFYRPTAYRDIDIRGFVGGGHAITIATAEIAKFFPDLRIITTTTEGEDKPTIARIYADELRRMGVPQNQIELEENSTNTVTELFEMVKLASSHKWNNVAIVTNEIHIDRVEAMLNHLMELAKRLNAEDGSFFEAWHELESRGGLDVHLISAEEVLLARHPRYEKVIKAVRESELYQRRREAENQGIKMINEGTYGKK